MALTALTQNFGNHPNEIQSSLEILAIAQNSKLIWNFGDHKRSVESTLHSTQVSRKPTGHEPIGDEPIGHEPKGDEPIGHEPKDGDWSPKTPEVMIRQATNR